MNKHGLRNHPAYVSWKCMIGRCYQPSNKSFKNYGALGITVCDEWRISPVAFIKWADANGFKIGLTIDRLDNKSGYSPNNCKWSGVQEQNNNKTNNFYINVDGVVKSVMDWSRMYGVNPYTIKNRIKAGWGHQDAVKLPAGTRTKQIV